MNTTDRAAFCFVVVLAAASLYGGLLNNQRGLPHATAAPALPAKEFTEVALPELSTAEKEELDRDVAEAKELLEQGLDSAKPKDAEPKSSLDEFDDWVKAIERREISLKFQRAFHEDLAGLVHDSFEEGASPAQIGRKLELLQKAIRKHKLTGEEIEWLETEIEVQRHLLGLANADREAVNKTGVPHGLLFFLLSLFYFCF